MDRQSLADSQIRATTSNLIDQSTEQLYINSIQSMKDKMNFSVNKNEKKIYENLANLMKVDKDKISKFQAT